MEHTQAGRTVVDRLGSGQTDRQTRQTDRLQQHCAQAVVERAPRRDWLEWVAGGAVSLRVVGWMWPAGDFVQAWQTSVVSSHNLSCLRSQLGPLPKMGPLNRLPAQTATREPSLS